uniref:Acetohydroxyacid synthetase small subunit n=1 Tax=Leptocylindrus danicus TaxID=163516 RepID=A0A023HB09_9STRA|nr:acetohydroxyacid synthetase small subunit [Leptocylindrus danicus]AGH28931.1 acetohydroxyacid synthetase small subunit [Leptocylindrus danicus]
MDYECTISVLLENHPNILTRITSLLARRGFAVDSLAIGTTELDTMSRLTLVVFGNNLIVAQITKQLYKLLPIMKVQDLTNVPSINREIILIKILCPTEQRSKILEIITFFRAKVVDFGEMSLILEITGNSEKIIAIEQLIQRFKIIECIRSGRIAIGRESIVTTKLFRDDISLNRRRIISNYRDTTLRRSYILEVDKEKEKKKKRKRRRRATILK